MRKYIAILLLAVSALFLFGNAAEASVTVTGYSYEQSTGDFTLSVKASEPWRVYRSTDLVHWEDISGVMGTGRKSFTDYGAGQKYPSAFYKVVPKGKKAHQNYGKHYGWYQDQNPHSEVE
jgi:hypothetical protein